METCWPTRSKALGLLTADGTLAAVKHFKTRMFEAGAVFWAGGSSECIWPIDRRVLVGGDDEQAVPDELASAV